jgi:DNA-binding NarL/FixJ family response regulator
MEKTRILLADDHAIVRQGLRQLIDLEPDLAVVGEAADGDQAIALAEALKPNVVVMDLHMPTTPGTQATREIRRRAPEARVIVLTLSHKEQSLIDARKAGAVGYVLKDRDASDLINAIRRVRNGEVLFDDATMAQVVKELTRSSEQARLEAGLTERETQVLRLVARGASNKQIAAKLNISEKTVKNHLSVIFEKLNVSSRTEAAIVALKKRLA